MRIARLFVRNAQRDAVTMITPAIRALHAPSFTRFGAVTSSRHRVRRPRSCGSAKTSSALANTS
jgi:hypothetical protein